MHWWHSNEKEQNTWESVSVLQTEFTIEMARRIGDANCLKWHWPWSCQSFEWYLVIATKYPGRTAETLGTTVCLSRTLAWVRQRYLLLPHHNKARCLLHWSLEDVGPRCATPSLSILHLAFPRVSLLLHRWPHLFQVALPKWQWLWKWQRVFLFSPCVERRYWWVPWEVKDRDGLVSEHSFIMAWRMP